MAGSLLEAAKSTGVSILWKSSAGGTFLFNVTTENAKVALQMVEKLCTTATKLGALFFGYKLMRPIVDGAVKKALGGDRDDQGDPDIGAGSLHVRLHCFTDERFLEVLADYESGRMKERLREEFSNAGIKVEGLKVEIENMAEVNETKEAINNRSDIHKDLCEDVKSIALDDDQRRDVKENLLEFGKTTALHFAALTGHIDVVKHLVENRAVDDKSLGCAIILCAETRNVVVLRSLVEYCSTVQDAGRESLQNAIMWAAENANVMVLNFLVEYCTKVQDAGREERPSELDGFCNGYAGCPLSCVSAVVSFILFSMGLPVCIRKFERGIQNDMCSLSVLCNVDSEVSKCSLALQDFYDNAIIEKKYMLLGKITDVNTRSDHLRKAIETMEREEHPALFIMHYRKKNDRQRTGHCVAIMPSRNCTCKFIDVQKERYWRPEKDPLWQSVRQIEVWRVDRKIAEEYWKNCGTDKCKRECFHTGLQ